MANNAKPSKKPASLATLPTKSHFQNLQLELFQQFLCNTDLERVQLSNTFDLWDSVPRYSISRQAMVKMRTENGFLDLLKIDFNYRGTSLKAIIQPARIEESDGSAQDYYPGASEELIEDALRKIAAEQNHGYFDKPNYRSGVVFTLHMLREELKKRGHARSYQQIILSLKILSGSVIELRAADGNNAEAFTRSPYFPSLAAVSRQRLKDDPNAKWVVQFHPLVTRSIDALTYRQFNYHQMMRHNTQLTRWLHKQLALKFTFASLTRPFEIRYSTIKRDSALLDGYSRERKAIEVLDAAFNELKAQKILLAVQKKELCGLRGKIDDVIYTLTPSRDFVAEMKAANKRHTLAAERRPDDAPGETEKQR
ncbi:MAG: replication protein [Candidatus Methylumidiphilus sp.]